MPRGMGGAGRYRHRVTILKRDESTEDSGGNPEPAWPSIGDRWGHVETRGGREFVESHQVHAEATHFVRMRSDSLTRTLSPKHRLQVNGRTLEIVHVVDVDLARVEVVAECKELVL